MSGKRQAQRTKNNARPSNSGRSAELLGNSSGQLFPTLEGGGSFAPLNDLNSDSNMPQEFQTLFKKMTKKDPITRHKALTELSSLCEQHEMDDVRTTLPSWVRAYKLMANDFEARVREAVQATHQMVLKTACLDADASIFQLYLKQIIGTWFAAQFDPASGVKAAANASLTNSFPGIKKKEMINRCKTELLRHIGQKIIFETPETVSSTQDLSATELQERYERVVATNLHAFGAFIKLLSNENLLAIETETKNLILNSTKFWKLASSGSNSLRCGWLTAIGALVENAPCYLRDSEKKASLAVYKNLDDPDNVILLLTWSIAIRSFEKNWQEHVSIEKLILPKLVKVLETNAYGCPIDICNYLITFINNLRLPIDYEFLQVFYSKLLTAIIVGLEDKKLHINEKQLGASVKMFFDLMHFILERHIENEDFCMGFVDNLLLHLMRKVMQEELLRPCTKLVASRFSFFMRTIQSKCSEQQSHKIVKLSEHVWETMWNIVTQNVREAQASDLDAERRRRLLDAQFMVLASLSQPEKFQTTRTNGPTQENAEHVQTKVRDLLDKTISLYYETSRNPEFRRLFVSHICRLVFTIDQPRYYQLLSNLVQERGINEALGEWMTECDVSTDRMLLIAVRIMAYTKDNNIAEMLDNLNEKQISSLVNISLQLGGEDQVWKAVKTYFASSTKFMNTMVQFAVDVSKGGSNQSGKVNILKKYFSVPLNGPLLSAMTTKRDVLLVFRDAMSREGDALSRESDDGVGFPLAALCDMATVLRELLGKHNHTFVLSEYADVTSVVGYLFLFTIDMSDAIDRNHIVYETWVHGVRSLASVLGCCNQSFIDVVEKFGTGAFELFQHSLLAKTTDTLKLAKKLVEVTIAFVETLPIEEEVHRAAGFASQSQAAEATRESITYDFCTTVYMDVTRSVCTSFLQTAVVTGETFIVRDLANDCLKGEYYCGEMMYYSNVVQQKLKKSLVASEWTYCLLFYVSALIHNYLMAWKLALSGAKNKMKSAEVSGTALSAKTSSGRDLACGAKSVKCIARMINVRTPMLSDHCLSSMTDSIGYMLYMLAVLRSYKTHFKHHKYYDRVVGAHLLASEKIIFEIINELTKTSVLALKLNLMERSETEGGLWAKTLPILCNEFLNENATTAYYDLVDLYETVGTAGPSYTAHVTQAFSKTGTLKIELYEPDAKLDKEKLAVLTCYLQNKKEINKFMEHIVWYWLDAILIHKNSLTVTFNANLMKCSISDITMSATVCRFLCIVASGKVPLVTDQRTDFMMLALASWMQSLRITYHESKINDIGNSGHSTPISILLSAVCEFYKRMTQLAAVSSDQATTSNKIWEEWSAVFSADANESITQIWLRFATESCRFVEEFFIIETLGGLIIDQVQEPPLKVWMLPSAKLLKHTFLPIRIVSFLIFDRISEKLMKEDFDKTLLNHNGELVGDNGCILSMKLLLNTSFQDLVYDYVCIGEKKDKETVVVSPDHEWEYANVHTYLLSWMLVIKMIERAVPEKRSKYAAWLKFGADLEHEPVEENEDHQQPLVATNWRNLPFYMTKFFDIVFKLLPEQVFQPDLTDGSIRILTDLFWNDPPYTMTDRWDGKRLAHLACRLICKFTVVLPTLTRYWWKFVCTKKQYMQLDRMIVQRFISNVAINKELKSTFFQKWPDSFEMKNNMATRQIFASYKVEESMLNLSLQLHPNHPLTPSKVEFSGTNIFAGKKEQWTQQLNQYICNHNGMLFNVFFIWKNNIDKTMEGLGECHICFAIIQCQNYQVPSVTCSTCRKTYHKACIVEWFTTGVLSSCPICRVSF